MDKEILLVPIYRCKPEKQEAEIEKDREKYLRFYKENGNKEIIERMSSIFDYEKWYSWKFNEAVGWIEIILNRSKLIGELWYVKNRISKKLKSKRFENRGKAFELFLHGVTSNENAISQINEQLVEWYKTNELLKNRFIDIDEASFKIGCVDWLKAIRLLTNA